MMLLFHIPRRVQSTYILECRGSIIGIATMIWGSIPIIRLMIYVLHYL